MKRFYLFIISIWTISTTLIAQDKLTVQPVGRILIDGGLFESNSVGLNNGMAIPDLRIGVQANYGAYEGYVDIGYANEKVHLKDVYIKRTFGKKDIVSLGHFYHHFGLQAVLSSSRKITMIEPVSDCIFVDGRQIGAMWIHHDQAFWGSLSLTVEKEAMKKNTNQTGHQAYGILSRMVYRPFRQSGQIFHVGFSWAYDTPQYNENEELNHRSYVMGCLFPTQIAEVTAVQTTIPEADHRWRFTPEICAAYGRIGIESQYYYTNIQRKEGYTAYKASGTYIQLRGLLKGHAYTYNETDSWINTPEKGSWECAIGYNYADLNDSKSNLSGGCIQDLSFTLNHYINPYITWRLRYSHTKSNSPFLSHLSINAIQTRIQFLF